MRTARATAPTPTTLSPRRERRIRDLIPEITKEPFKPTTQFIILEVGLEDDEGSVVIPPVLFFL